MTISHGYDLLVRSSCLLLPLLKPCDRDVPSSDILSLYKLYRPQHTVKYYGFLLKPSAGGIQVTYVIYLIEIYHKKEKGLFTEPLEIAV